MITACHKSAVSAQEPIKVRCVLAPCYVCYLIYISRTRPYSRQPNQHTNTDSEYGTAILMDEHNSFSIPHNSEQPIRSVLTPPRHVRRVGGIPPSDAATSTRNSRSTKLLPTGPIPTPIYVADPVSTLCRDMLLVLQRAGESDAPQLDSEVSREANTLLAKLLSGGIAEATEMRVSFYNLRTAI